MKLQKFSISNNQVEVLLSASDSADLTKPFLQALLQMSPGQQTLLVDIQTEVLEKLQKLIGTEIERLRAVRGQKPVP